MHTGLRAEAAAFLRGEVTAGGQSRGCLGYHHEMDALWSTLGIRVSQPAYLAILAVIPIVVLLARRSLAGLGRLRRPVTLVLRSAVIALLALALCGPDRVRVTDDQTAIFVIDQSASVPRDAQQAAFEFAQEAAKRLRRGKDRIALLSFDGRAIIEQLPHSELRVDRPGLGSKPHRTDLSGALRMAMALFPPDAARRIVLLSDGNENVGQVLEDAAAFAAAGVPVDVAPRRYTHQREMLVERLSSPASVKLNDTVNLGLIVRSQARAAARLLLYQNDELLDLDPATDQAGFPMALEPGHSRFTFPVTFRESGAHRFRAVLQPDRAEDDAVLANNEGRAFTVVGEAERVLILTEATSDPTSVDAESANVLARALRQAKVDCDVRSIDSVSLDPEFLTGCSLVILSNVSAFSVGESQQRALASYVRDLGGGLIAIGGDSAFSMGGYQRTPLEEVLPVETDRSKLKLMSLSLVIVLDRSGSMAGEKLDLAKRAALGAVQLLSRSDRVGVIAFDSYAEWIVPLAPCDAKQETIGALASIGVGGGTNMYPALEEAHSALVRVNTNLKHVILLTDGQSEPGDFRGIAQQFGKSGISISTIAIGPDADRESLGEIAKLSGGRSYQTNSAQPLPQIFLRETVLASRSGLLERDFTPTLRAAPDDPVFKGIVQSDIPQLNGYVITAAKPMAQTPLVRLHDDGTDPILAYWQAGLGRSIAFTSGLWPRWGAQWVNWPGFGKLWEQCVRYAARGAQSGEFQIATQVEGDRGRLTLEFSGSAVSGISSASFSGQLAMPDFSAQPLEIRQTGPGRFEATFAAPDPGTYIASIAYQYGSGSSRKSGRIQTGLTVTYSPEFAVVTHNETLLAELARRTGGRVLNPDQAAAVLDPGSMRRVEARAPIWQELVGLALLAFLVEVAVRRLAIRPGEALRRVRSYLREIAGQSSGARAEATVATLRGVRKQVQSAQAPAATAVLRDRINATSAPAESRASRGRTSDTGADDDLALLLDGQREKPVVAAPRRDAAPPKPTEAEYAARLLRAKRDAKRLTQADDDQ